MRGKTLLIFLVLMTANVCVVNAQPYGIIDAARRGDDNAVRKLLEKDASLAREKDQLGYTALDWAAPRGKYEHLRLPDHVGSNEVRRFIGRTTPYLFLSGHCHESVIFGNYRTFLGETPCVNPGSEAHASVLSVVQFDVFHPSGEMKQFFIRAD